MAVVAQAQSPGSAKLPCQRYPAGTEPHEDTRKGLTFFHLLEERVGGKASPSHAAPPNHLGTIM